MRKFIIDTDAGTDDAAAMLMAMSYDDIEILGFTVVFGNVSLDKAVRNSLQTVEIAGKNIPVYIGSEKPLKRKLISAEYVHGSDGMGDAGLINPKGKPMDMCAADFILNTVEKNPGEIEIITLGPATNIALAIKKAPEIMKRVKHIWSMGTAGFGKGNCSPVAEFNVFSDAESYKIMLEAEIPVTVIGFDLCRGDAEFSEQDLNEISAYNNNACKFFATAVKSRMNYSERYNESRSFDLPDAVAIAVALEPQIVLSKVCGFCYCCTEEVYSYGQVIIYDEKMKYHKDITLKSPNAEVIEKIDGNAFKTLFVERIKSL